MQLQGTSMGSPAAPNYADIFRSKVECGKILSSPHGAMIKSWQRFVDNIFMICSGSEEELYIFVFFINDFHLLLEFSLTKS